MKTVLSASRRTDIPAFYMEWFMERIRKGVFKVPNPYNGSIRTVPAGAGQLHTIVFWSKNFGPFLEFDYGDALRKDGYNLYFNFTINTESNLLEPAVPALDLRLEQLERMCHRFGAESIAWRFDPICFYRFGEGETLDNLGQFDKIAATAGRCGVRRCITSFMDHYPKIGRRLTGYPGLRFIVPPLEQKKAVLNQLSSTLERWDIELEVCCEKEVMEILDPDSRVKGAHCIASELLEKLYDERLSRSRDRGQRIGAGCGCRISSDIGTYNRQPCRHGCLYCYANPSVR